MADATLYLVYGNDEYLVSQKAKAIVAQLVPEDQRALKLEIIDGAVDTMDAAITAVQQSLTALQSIGLFSDEKVIWLQNVSFLTDTRAGKAAGTKEAVQRLTDRIKTGLPPGQVLVVTAPGVDKRRAFYKACKAAGELHEYMIPAKSYQADRLAAERLDQLLARANLRMSHPAKVAFLEKVGADTRQLVNEVEKLAVYVGEAGTTVDIDAVQAIVSSSREALAWDLADAFGKRELTRALAILRQLVFQRENVIGLIVGLENRVRDLIVYREALDKGWLVKSQGYHGRPGATWGNMPPEIETLFADQMGRDPRKMHYFRVSVLADQARKFSNKRLYYCLKQVTEAHAQLVSSRIPPDMTLELLLIRMLATVRKPRTR